jgi:hypothetical protein
MVKIKALLLRWAGWDGGKVRWAKVVLLLPLSVLGGG